VRPLLPVSGWRFSFEVAGVHEVASLAADLRALTGRPVLVRPASRGVGSPQLWSVLLDTPPAPNGKPDIQGWEDSMRDVADRHPGCRFVGWQALPEAPE
jgi:hypothetical protein